MNERLHKLALRLRYRGDNGYGSHAWEFTTDDEYLAGLGCGTLVVFTKGSNAANAAAHTLRILRNAAVRQAGPGCREAAETDVLAAVDAMPDTHISRDEVILRMKAVAADFARRLGYDELTVGEDRQKGIWGEDFTKFLERHHGPCTEEHKWTHETKPGMVEFRFRCATPTICIHTYEDGGRREAIAVVEVDQRYDCVEQRRHGDWAVTETMTFNIWNTRSRNLVNQVIAALVKEDVIR